MSEMPKDPKIPATGPQLTLDEAARFVIANNPRFECGPATIRGIEYTVFTAAPASLYDLLLQAQSVQTGGDFLVFGDRNITYSEFLSDVERLGGAMQKKLGVKKGQPVAIAMQNCPEMMVAFMAIVSIGAVAVFVNAWWTTDELDYAMRDSGSRIVFADARRAERLAPIQSDLDLTIVGIGTASAEPYADMLAMDLQIVPQKIDTDDNATIMYSSGTTGEPKGVVQTHRSAISAVYTWLMQTEIAKLRAPVIPNAPAPKRPGFLIVTPLFHVTASHGGFLFALAAGAKLVLMEKWNAEDAVRLIDHHEVTRMVGVPTQSADLIGAAKRLGSTLASLVTIGSGGAKQPASQVAKVKEAFPLAQPATGWGMTETNAMGFGINGPDYAAHPDVSGRLYPPLQEIRFVDDDGQDVPAGEVGEILIKSPCVMREYLNKPEDTDRALMDGWLSTGDLGKIDADGIITIVDRKKNIIVRGGENISCLDVESALYRHPAVIEAAVFSVPDERLGEVVGAGIFFRDPTQEDDLKAFLADHIAHFKIPSHIWSVGEPLPRVSTGKIDARSIRSKYLELMAASEGGQS